MAVSQNFIVGKTSGSAGGVTFTTWKGKNVFKSKPQTVGNPQTERQTNQRGKFTFMVFAMRSLLALIRRTFKEQAATMTEANAFMSANTSSLDVVNDKVELNSPAVFLVSKGTLSKPLAENNAQKDGTGINIVKINDAVNVFDDSSDRIGFAMYDKTNNAWSYSLPTIKRTDVGVLDTGLVYTPNTIAFVWCFYMSEDGRKSSDSVLIGQIPAI